MKKFLMIILLILCIVLAFFLVVKNITIANWTSKNINNIKDKSDELNEQINTAKELINQEYPQSLENIESSYKQLKIAKEEYEGKSEYVTDDTNLGVVQTKEYKIEKLWIVLENYAKDENIELKLDLLDTETEGIYDLDITISGDYIAITDFIYDIENDDTLGFTILNFRLVPYGTVSVAASVTEDETTETGTNEEEVTEEDSVTEDSSEQTSSGVTTSSSVSSLTATFRIEGVAVSFD